jgi:hypothetical protein
MAAAHEPEAVPAPASAGSTSLSQGSKEATVDGAAAANGRGAVHPDTVDGGADGTVDLQTRNHMHESPKSIMEKDLEDREVESDGGTDTAEEKVEDEDEDEDEEGEDEDEEDEEPALKYERIGGSFPDLFKKDSASAMAVSNKLLVIPCSCTPYILLSALLQGHRHARRHRTCPRPVRKAYQVLQTSYCVRHRHSVRAHRGLHRHRVP